MQAPCIFINRDDYRDIKHKLDKLGFNLSLVQFEKNLSLLVTNYNNKKGKCGIINRYIDTASSIYNRTICRNKNTFIYMCNVYMGKINENNMNDEMQTKSNKNNFTKSDLKSGMIVQLNNGNYYIILESDYGPKLCGNNTIALGYYDDNLNYCNTNCYVVETERFDINKVFLAKYNANIECYLKGEYLKEIWSRPNIINITEKDLKKFKSNDSDIIKLKLNNGEVITIE